jgi:hypothetical protein
MFQLSVSFKLLYIKTMHLNVQNNNQSTKQQHMSNRMGHLFSPFKKPKK